MHSMGLHSALAIKRQRKRRADMKKAKGRRYSLQSTESGLGGSQSSFASPRNSIDGIDGERKKRSLKSKVTSFESNVGIGMLQIGVVFVVLGVFLLGSTLIPDDFDDWSWQNIFTKKAWWNELVITGTFALLLGVFLIVLDRIISRKEEEDLNEYVQGQLTRSRSGHRLVRDLETGNLVPKRTKPLNPVDGGSNQELDAMPAVHSPKLKTPPPSSGNHVFMNGETGLLSPQLEKILEEDISPLVDQKKSVGMHSVSDEYEYQGIVNDRNLPSGYEGHETQGLIGPSSHSHSVKKYHQVVLREMKQLIPRKITIFVAHPLEHGAETTINMMGAMPAVAVRLERRKAEQRMKRPSQLYLGGYPHLRQQTASPSKGNSPSPSPLLSPPRLDEEQRLPEVYVCGRVSALHLAVVSLLLGAVILIVGLVQLKPGADAPGHRYYLIAVGCLLEVLGLLITATRCVLLHLKIKKRRSSSGCSSSKKCEKIVQASSSSHVEAKESTVATVNGKNRDLPSKDSLSPPGLNQRHLNLKHLYNSSDVIYADELSDSTVDMAKSKSPIGSLHTIDVIMGSTNLEIVPQVTEARSLSAVSQGDGDNGIIITHPIDGNKT